MPNLPRTLTIAAALGLIAGLASAAKPGRPKAGARPTGSRGAATKIAPACTSKPSEAQCSAVGYLDKCGKKWGESCRDYIQDEIKKEYNASTVPKTKMFLPNRDDIPAGIIEGKTEEYPQPEHTVKVLGTYPKIKTIGGVKKKPKMKSTIRPMAKKARRPALNGTKMSKFGKVRPKAFKLSPVKRGKGFRTMTSDNMFSRTGLTRPSFSGLGAPPYNAHRSPKWEANGNKVKSCEEYAYEKTYDWARYTDAVAACSGDHNCQMDVAFLPTTPGIADRELKAKDGTKLASQIKTKKGFKFAKNDFFVAGKNFARANLDDLLPMTPELEALQSALEDGSEYYKIGCGKRSCGANQYRTEWDFHRSLHDRNRTVTEAEFEEYEIRKNRMRELLFQWNWAVREQLEKRRRKANKGFSKQWESPLDQVSNPFEQMNSLKQSNARLARAAKNLGKGLRKGAVGKGKGRMSPKTNKAKGRTKITPSKARPSSRGINRGAAVPTNRGRNRARGARTGVLDTSMFGGEQQPTSVMGFKPKGKPRPSSSKPGNANKKAQFGKCHPANFSKGINELMLRGPISCQIGHLLRQEWKRKAKGERTCLDLGNDDCDWSPMLFERRFVHGVPYAEEQAKHEEYCLDYTFDQIDKPTLTAAKKYIDKQKKDISEAMEKLKPYMKDWDAKNPQGKPAGPKGFGKSWTDADHFGDKALMAAGYDYDLGWDVSPRETKNKKVCELEGGARGGFGVDGWFINSSFEIVDALAAVDWNREQDVGTLDVHMRVFKQDVFAPYAPDLEKPKNAPKGWKEKKSKKHIHGRYPGKFKAAWEEPLFDGSISIPGSPKPMFLVWAGPIPISGAVWGEFAYGAKLAVEPISETDKVNGVCDMQNLKFGVEAVFTPSVGLNAKAQIGVGIAGLLSAGIRGMINLVSLSVPVEAKLYTTIKPNNTPSTLNFDLDVRLSIETLSGWIAAYVEFLFIEEEFIIFRWNGLGPETISLFGEPLKAELPLGVMGG